MIVKAPGPDEILAMDRIDDPVAAAYCRIMRLKRLFRQGWLKRGIPESVCESVADHSFGVAMLALLVPCPAEVDRSRAAVMALVHEIGETYAGDITPVDGVPPAEKERLERAALLRALGDHPESGQWLGLWEDFEFGKSPEARFVRQLDRLEMGFQAAVYRAEGSPAMGEFFDSARRSIVDPGLQALLDEAIGAS